MGLLGSSTEVSAENIELGSKFAKKQRTGSVIFVGLRTYSHGGS